MTPLPEPTYYLSSNSRLMQAAREIERLIAENAELKLANEQLGELGKQVYAELAKWTDANSKAGWINELRDHAKAGFDAVRELEALREELDRVTTLARGQHVELYNARLELERIKSQEPVAWMHESAPAHHIADAGKPIERKPLTDDELESLVKWIGPPNNPHFNRREYARAVEAAHGIKEQA